MRTLISTGSPWEPKVGYSRAVIVNDTIFISGTAGKGPDVYTQTRDALATIEMVLTENGFAVDVSSVIRASPDSFRVAWVQRTYQDGSLASTERWTAILTVVVQVPRDADKLQANPLGIYVTAINWSKELTQ